MSNSDPTRRMLRHTIATLAYRGSKAVRGDIAQVAETPMKDGIRTPVEILAHIGDVLDWALSIASGNQKWDTSAPLPWEQQVDRFYASLAALDDYLASDEPLHAPAEKLFQGPIADALTHVGQINMLRRAGGAPVKGENYFRASIVAGTVGRDQPPPAFEFD